MKTTGIVAASAVFLLAAARAHAQSPPVGYWKGDDSGSSGQALNSVTNTNDGTYLGSATIDATNKPTLLFTNASSMSFNGTSAYVNVPTFSWPTGGGPVTVSFWNYVTTPQVSSAFTVGSVDSPSRFQTHAPWSDGKIYWDYGDLNANGRISTDYLTKVNKWTHVALVSAGKGGAFKAIYLDGAVAAAAATSDGPTQGLTGLNIGRWGSSYHKGLIDDFRIYNRVLSASEIQALAAGNTEISAPMITSITGSIGQVDLTWTTVSGATSYNVKYGTSWGGPYPTVVPVTGTSTTITGLTYSTQYYFVVSSVNGLGESLNSYQDTAKVLGPPRTAVVGQEKDQCGVGVASGTGWGPLACGLAALAVLTLFGRQRTRPNAILR
jgi:hypothetical protein